MGLAPAAHGGTRTGRVFTGDRSGDWLYRALHRFEFVNQPHSVDRSDGLKLADCYITAVLHCAPPLNKPQPQEVANCKPYLARELELLAQIRVIVALGKIAFDNIWPLIAQPREKRPRFQHGRSPATVPPQAIRAAIRRIILANTSGYQVLMCAGFTGTPALDGSDHP